MFNRRARLGRGLSHVSSLRLSFLPRPVVPLSHIRNFNIIAHIDHGKSTLADRLLEWTGTIKAGSTLLILNSLEGHKQYLDKLRVEQARGITVQAQSAAMFFAFRGEQYLLNLIDTPGHVDFHYEVSRSMRSCSGSLLLVDATQGVQAQTLSNFEIATREGLTILPIINKIDLPTANVEETRKVMVDTLHVRAEDVRLVSAKANLGIAEVLQDVVERIRPPVADLAAPFKAFLINC